MPKEIPADTETSPSRPPPKTPPGCAPLRRGGARNLPGATKPRGSAADTSAGALELLEFRALTQFPRTRRSRSKGKAVGRPPLTLQPALDGETWDSWGDQDRRLSHSITAEAVESAIGEVCFQKDLSCISASLPKTEAHWQDVIRDLEIFENLIQSIHIDATLYTESDVQPNCKVTAMKCFLLELCVIWQESNNDIREVIGNIVFLANSSLPSNGTITESGCKECEELEEKNVKEFLRSFVNIVQMFINTS